MGIQSLLNDPVTFLRTLLLSLPGILLALCGHEAAHGWVAWKCGDPTAKLMGRVTLNPVKHIDPVGFFCMLFVGLGWAKPVPVNPFHFRHGRRDDLKVSLAGITANLIMCLIGFMLLMLILSLALSSLPSYDLGSLGGLSGSDTFYFYTGSNTEFLQVKMQPDGSYSTETVKMGLLRQISGNVYSVYDLHELCGHSRFFFDDGEERLYYSFEEDMLLDMKDIFQLSSGIWSFGNGSGEYFGIEELLITPTLGKVGAYAFEIVRIFMVMNLTLAVFNLIPLPPLDGYHVLNDLFLKLPFFAPARAQRVGSLLLVALIMLGNVSEKLDFISIGLRFIHQHAFDGLTTAAYHIAQLLSLI